MLEQSLTGRTYTRDAYAPVHQDAHAKVEKLTAGSIPAPSHLSNFEEFVLDRGGFSSPEPAELEHGGPASKGMRPPLKPDSEVGESCSCCLVSATKGGHDPPAIILFRRYDGRISRILEHELSNSVFGLRDRLTSSFLPVFACGFSLREGEDFGELSRAAPAEPCKNTPNFLAYRRQGPPAA